jgi:hypothetical protein
VRTYCAKATPVTNWLLEIVERRCAITRRLADGAARATGLSRATVAEAVGRLRYAPNETLTTLVQ